MNYNRKGLDQLTETQKENLRKVALYTATIPQELFDMSDYRIGREQKFTRECNTVGCILGHCTILFPEEEIPRIGGLADNPILFYELSYRLFGIIGKSLEYHYLFHHAWEKIDNTPEGASQRILNFLEHGVPEGFVPFVVDYSD